METYFHDLVNEYFNLETKNRKFTCFVSKNGFIIYLFAKKKICRKK